MTRAAYEEFANKIVQKLGRQVGDNASLFFFQKDEPSDSPFKIEFKCNFQSFLIFGSPPGDNESNHTYYVGVSKTFTKETNFLTKNLVRLTVIYLQDLWNGRYDTVDLDSDGDVETVSSVILRQFVELFSDITGIDLITLDALSLRNYESQKCRGTLLFLEDRVSIKIDICIGQNETSNSNIYFCSDRLRLIRKLMAGGEGYALAFRRPINPSPSAKYKLEGYSKKQNDGWVINITHPGVFTVSLGNQELFRMNHLCPQIVQNQWEQQLQTLIKVFNVQQKPDIYKKLFELLKLIDENRHGAAVLLLNLEEGSRAAERINKLCSLERGYAVKGNPSVAQAFMDGAIVVNVLNAQITHVGVIVDGVVWERGDIARGARHNSLATFCSDFHASCPTEPVAAIVFSEDGGSTLYCYKAVQG